MQGKTHSTVGVQCLVDTQRMIGMISFVGLSHCFCLKVKVLVSNKSCFIDKCDYIFNNANLLTTDKLAVLIGLMD